MDIYHIHTVHVCMYISRLVPLYFYLCNFIHAVLYNTPKNAYLKLKLFIENCSPQKGSLINPFLGPITIAFILVNYIPV